MTTGYRALAGSLRAAILRGEYPAGSTLPRQDDLAVQYQVNVKTVRNAVALLAAEGLVTPVRRRGTVVRERPPMRRLGIERYAKSKWKYGNLVAFAADREASGQAWKLADQTQTVARAEADAEIAEAFGIEIGDVVFERARLVKDAEGNPTHTLTSYYLPEDVEGTPLVDPAPGPAGRGGGFAVLTMQGLEPDGMTETFRARPPTPEEIDLLELPPGECVVELHRQTVTAEGRVVEFARGIHAASRFAWSYTFKIPE